MLHWFVVFLLNLIGSSCLLLLDTAPQVRLMLYSDSYFPLASFPLELLPVKIEQLATPSVQSTRYESASSTVKHLHHRLGRLVLREALVSLHFVLLLMRMALPTR